MPLCINPPLVNSSNPWATTAEDLRTLYECPHTGAVSVRTSLIQGFEHDDAVHKYAFFDAQTHVVDGAGNSSLNTLGYSPVTLGEYLEIIEGIVQGKEVSRVPSHSSGVPARDATANGSGNSATAQPAYKKPFIISVTGTPGEIVECHRLITAAAGRLAHPLYMEINLSCPNIPGKVPPAYDGTRLKEYLAALQQAGANDQKHSNTAAVPVGIKLPPYTYLDQFTTVVSALQAADTNSALPACPVAFITSTNTLGSSLLLSPGSTSGASHTYQPALSSSSDPASTGIGGLAGAVLHPLSLGNVATLRRLLDESGNDTLKAIEIIGIGGVSDRAGYDRMRAVGANVVGVGTALGVGGVAVFGKILLGPADA